MEVLADSAFRWAAEEDSLCEENTQGVESDLADVPLCTDAYRRGAGRIKMFIGRACSAAELTAQPTWDENQFRAPMQAGRPSTGVRWSMPSVRLAERPAGTGARTIDPCRSCAGKEERRNGALCPSHPARVAAEAPYGDSDFLELLTCARIESATCSESSENTRRLVQQGMEESGPDGTPTVEVRSWADPFAVRRRSRLPRIPAAAQGLNRSPLPDEAVARGVAAQAGSLNDDENARPALSIRRSICAGNPTARSTSTPVPHIITQMP